jgi:transcriptional regulator
MDANVVKSMEKYDKFSKMTEKEMLNLLRAAKIQRKIRGVSQGVMAKMLGTSIPNISVYENKDVFNSRQSFSKDSIFKMLITYETELKIELI